MTHLLPTPLSVPLLLSILMNFAQIKRLRAVEAVC